MSKEEKIYTGFLPREWQEEVHDNLKRFNVLVLHRRAGKSVFCINEIIHKGLQNPLRNPQYAYIAPTYGAAKRIAWDFAKDFTKNIPGVESNEQDLKITIPRPWLGDSLKIFLLGAENPGNIRGIYLDGVVLDEFSEMHPMIWTQVVRPALSDREGWLIVAATPKGMNHFKELYDLAGSEDNLDKNNWYRFMLKASESKILPESELRAAQATMSEEEYNQEYEVDWGAALVGSYYAKQLKQIEEEKRIMNVPYDKAVPVETYWDLGIGDTTAIWFIQSVGREYHIIDHLESSGMGLDYYVKELFKRNYIYYEHVLPHDAQARELGSGKTRVETLQNFGLGRIRVLERHEVDDGIHAVRMVLGKCFFDKDKTIRGLDALRAYEKKWDQKNKIFTNKPLHNWASHSADAFRTFAMGVRGPERRFDMQRLPRSAESSYDIFNYHGED